MISVPEFDINEECPLLSGINTPDDLRRLPLEQLPQVCSEIRKFLIDTLSRNFQPNEVVTLEAVRARKLVAKDVDYLKVLARGYIDKPLIVEAHDFSMDAVKMILLTGGRAIRKKK